MWYGIFLITGIWFAYELGESHGERSNRSITGDTVLSRDSGNNGSTVFDRSIYRDGSGETDKQVDGE